MEGKNNDHLQKKVSRFVNLHRPISVWMIKKYYSSENSRPAIPAQPSSLPRAEFLLNKEEFQPYRTAQVS